jgi:RecA-family ATPase/DNA polymerase I-like protein with 3'-5' exonuclease and polymerase domains
VDKKLGPAPGDGRPREEIHSSDGKNPSQVTSPAAHVDKIILTGAQSAQPNGPAATDEHAQSELPDLTPAAELESPCPVPAPNAKPHVQFLQLGHRYIIPATNKRRNLCLCFDVEADGLLDAATKIHCIVIADLDRDRIAEYGPGQIVEALAHLSRAEYLTGHNIEGYDLPLLRRLHGWRPSQGCTVVDTLIASRLILPHLLDLDQQAQAIGNPSLGKLAGRHRLEAWGLRLGMPKVGSDIEEFSEWTPELQQRCVGDVRLTKALWKFLQPDGQFAEALTLEHRVATICAEITAAGIPFDTEAAERLREQWTAQRAELEAKLRAQFPDVKNWNSRAQIATLLESRGWEPERRTEKTGQAVIDDELLETVPRLYPEFAGLAEHNMFGRRLGQLANGKRGWLRNVGNDARIHGRIIHIGTPHSRAAHLEPNLAQVPNPKKGKPLATECRALFRTRDDWVFVTCDQAGLQDRAFAHYLATFDGGAYAKAFLNGLDPHWSAVLALGLMPAGTLRDKENKLHAALREGSKSFRYGFLFGMGAERAGTIVRNTIKAAEAADPTCGLMQRFFGAGSPDAAALRRVGTEALHKFVAATPGLGQLRRSLEAQARKGWIPGLDGRRVPVRALYTVLNYAVTSAEAVICKRWLANVHDELRRQFKYGWEGDVVLVGWIHDELVACCRPEIADQVGAIMVRWAIEAGEHYNFKVPLDADYKVGRSWAGDDPIDKSNGDAPEPPEIGIRSGPNVELAAAAIDDGLHELPVPAPKQEPKPAPKSESKAEPERQGAADGSRTAVIQDKYVGEHAGEPFNDLYLRQQGYIPRSEFNYTLPDGTLVYQQLRYELRDGITPTEKRPRKRFLPRHQVNGGWVLGAGKRRVLFNWPAIVRAGPGATIIVTEGEGNAADLIKAGLLATTVLSHQWGPECVAALTGCHLIILEDHDEDGRRLAEDARCKLAPVAASIRVVPYLHLWKHLPLEKRGAEPALHEDVSDWIKKSVDLTKLIEICREIPIAGAAPTIINIREWDDQAIPEQEWAVPDRYPRRQTGLFSGEGGEGKSSVVLHLCAAHAVERDWLGTTPQPGPAIFIDAEDDVGVLRRRCGALVEHYGVRFHDLAAKLTLVSLVGEDAVLAAPARRTGIIEPTGLYKWLLELAGDTKPVMIGIASSADVFAGNEIDRSQVRQFIRMLTRVAIVSNGGVVLITHPSLTGIATGTGLSGSTQWHNSVRARAVMGSVKASGDKAQRDVSLRQIEFRKNNYGPISATCFVRWQNGMFLPVEGLHSMDAAERAAKADEVFLALLRKFSEQKQTVSPNPGRSSAPARFAEHPDAQGLLAKELAAAMQRLLDAKVIEIRTWGPPSKQRQCVALVGSEK